MSNENTTAQAPVATISEKELWALFIASTWQTTSDKGLMVQKEKPEDLLRDRGSYGHTVDFASALADAVEEVDEPGGELDCFIDDIERYLENLKSIRDLFERLKNRLVDDGDGDELRFRLPVSGAEA